jgi:hypothetical protein
MKILFPDTSSIERMDGIEFHQGEIQKRKEPVLVPEYPWEEIHTYLYGSVLKKGPLYRMWYQSYVDGLGFFVNYARSTDGITWSKPLIKRYCFETPELYPTVAVGGEIKDFYLKSAKAGNCKTNIVSTYHIPSVIYDPDDKNTPYKLFGYSDAGYCTAFSRDGIHFRTYEHNPVIPVMRFPNSYTKKTWFSDVSPAFKDVLKNRFVAFVKTYIIDDEGRTRRSVGFSESRDFRSWSKPETIWAPGPSEDALALANGFKWADFYGLCGFNYGNGYLGFLWLFNVDHEVEKGTHDGKVEVYLAYSSNGENWKRLSDEPFIPLSRDGWDTDMIYTSNAPVFKNDETVIYYSGSNFGHGIGHEETPYEIESHRFCIGVVSVRKDGLAYSVSPSKGYFLTKPATLRKGLLRLNVDAGNGKVSVELMKGTGNIESFDISGVNSIDYTVRTGVKGNIALKIHLHNARLYSLEAL